MLAKSLILFRNLVVPGGGFEPPTRGFSVRCSTPELPGHVGEIKGATCVGASVIEKNTRSVQHSF